MKTPDEKLKHLKSLAKDMRKNMTKEECHLWFDFLREYPVKILRQKIIGNYIVDFYCASAKLGIELDGSQHYEAAALEYDAKRTAEIAAHGVKIVRFTNLQIWREFESVKLAIHQEIENRREYLGKK